MSNLTELKKELKSLSDFEKAKNLQRFFKTGKGEYGEGDVFLGVIGGVPTKRKIAKRYLDLSFNNLQNLLDSSIHEHRFIALVILNNQFIKFVKLDSAEKQKEIFDFYIKNTKKVNNWDLVDTSAPNIVGQYLLRQGLSKRKILYRLAKSENLWEKRISIISTYAFIREGEFDDTLKISEILLNDEHDLIHKAVGWMLREVGNRNREVEEKFLKKHYLKMPRTMLRYAIEKFPEDLRQKYLKGKI
ncbi:DNA alkylation repair protein [Patescibacteria group bacterium]|nr:DNA alkylation repair protein [Patescibacteria group bacterium]